tara:strand:- start:39 stop:455 length:417 start_codon:yes stop_codon:yes gene_type:complete
MMKRYRGSEISIPYAAMMKLRKSGKLNLGMIDDLAMKIADSSKYAPSSKGGSVAMHFWSWVAVGQFLYSIYWSFTGLWWIFIPSFFLMFVIHRANKKGTSENLMAEAERDKSFYEKVRKIDGWEYELDENEAKKYKKK